MSEGPADTEFVTLVDLIDRLVPVSDPEPVALVPQTAGWWWLAAALSIGVLALVWRLMHRRRRNAYRRHALAALQDAQHDGAALAAVLRRTALAAYPRAEVASLTGPRWLAFLDSTMGGTHFENGAGRAIVELPYRSGSPVPPDVVDVVRRWIREHRRVAER